MAAVALTVAFALTAPAPVLASTPTHFVSAHEAVAQYGPAVRKRLAPAFRSAGVAYPPRRLVFAAIKGERVLRVYAARNGALRYITSYRILGASGHAGPKLREGDRQVPEGVYRIKYFDANTPFHLALVLDYPNAFDRARARHDGRSNLGDSIYIHGGARSTGCLAMGDSTAEKLFVLAADAGIDNVKVVIAPSDPRTGPLKTRPGEPAWTPALYAAIAREFARLPRPPVSAKVSAAATAATAIPAVSAAPSSSLASAAVALPLERSAHGINLSIIAYSLLAGLVVCAGVGMLMMRVFSAVHERR